MLMVTQPGTRDEVGEFANAIGEWLLTQEFGTIKPLAFRHHMGWSPDEDDAYVVIELLVTDPPPPPPIEEQRQMTRDELAAALSWPLDDWWAVFYAARDKAAELGPPARILNYWPVDVRMFPESKAERHGFVYASA